MTARSPQTGPFLVEVAEWTPGVYQWQTDDVILGGPDGNDNWPTQALANRTAWLKQQLLSTTASIATHEASRNHPAATTAAQGMVQLATVAEALAGIVTTKSVTPDGLAAKVAAATPDATTATKGVVQLATIAEALAGVATTKAVTPDGLAARIAALVNSSPAALDTLSELSAALGNDANFATTITNALAAKAPKDSPLFTTSAKGPTPAQFSKGLDFATMEAVQRALGNMSGYIGLTGNTVLTADKAGKAIICSSISNFTVTLPAANAMPLADGGGIFHILNSGGTGTVTVSAAGADPIYVNGTGTVSSISLGPGDDIVLLALGSGGTYWYTFGGTAQLKYAAGFAASLGAAGSSGYQKLPSGLIIQWGYAFGSAQPFSVTFPIAFLSAAYGITVGGNGLSTSNVTSTINSLTNTGFQATCWSGGAASSNSSVAIYWTALGK